MAADPVVRRLHTHALCSRMYFYIPVMYHHLDRGTRSAGIAHGHAWSLAILALFAVGMAVSEFPSGVFADWAGRVRSVQVCSLLFACGMLCYLWPSQLWLLAIGQLVLGVGTGFLSGADTALLHQHCERQGRPDAYGGALARLRFWNAVGLVIGPGLGGLLWVWWWPSVFWFTMVMQLIGAAVLFGVAEPPRPHAGRRYRHVLVEALAFTLRDRRLLAMLAVASCGSALYGYVIWTIQIHLQDAGTSAPWWGLAVAVCWALAAATQPLSAWVGRTAARSARAWPWLLAAVPGALAALWVAQSRHQTWLGATVVVVAAAATALYRNACNVELQHLAPDALRASLVSMWNWLGSIWYLACFPLFGWCLDRFGTVAGYGWIAALSGGLVAALLAGAALGGLWRTRPAHTA